MKRKSDNSKNSSKRKKVKSNNEYAETAKAEVLDAQGLREGMVLLGCIIEVRPSGLVVSLPGCMVGHVSLTGMSEKYTELLVRSDVEENIEVTPLSQMVDVGSTHPFKVLKVTFKEPLKKPSISLSMDPLVVNSELRPQSLYSKMVLHAAVSSIEDHGHVMETGVPGVQGFLPFSLSPRGSLAVGQVVSTVIRKLPSEKWGNVAWLGRLASDEPPPEIEDDKIALTSLLPGAKITALITEIKQPFIYMKLMNFDACANMMSLGGQHHFNEATQVSGTVLFVHPVSRLVHLQLAPVPSPCTFSSFFRLHKYDFTKNIRFELFWSHRILFRIGKKDPLGFVKKRKMSDRGFLSQDALAKNPVIPKARVVFLHYMDNLVELSLYESVINMEVIKPEEVQVGDIYEGTVSKHVRGGMFVSICPGLSGFVRCTHMSDALVTMPEKLFPVSAKVKCRVVSIRRKEGNDSLHLGLTSKESLVSLSPDALLLSYAQAQEEDTFKGVVVHRTERNMLVLFFNDVRGIIYEEEIPEASVYFVGQTVSCRVIECHPKDQKLKFSLKPVPEVNEKAANKKSSARKKPKKKLPSIDGKKEESMFEKAFGNKLSQLENKLKKKLLSLNKKETTEKLDPSKKCRAIIQSRNNLQLNVILLGGQRGRVHVTELGDTEEFSMPLRNFKPFQSLQVHALGTFEAKLKAFLEISHRRTRLVRECSLTYPPPVPLRQKFRQGEKVMAYVKKVNSTSCTLWISPTQTATLEYLHYSGNPKELRKLHKRLKIGVALKAQVLTNKKVKKGKEFFCSITLTRLGSNPVRAGHNAVGLVQAASIQDGGVSVRLAHGMHGTACLPDLRDDQGPVWRVLERCRKLLFITCHVLEVDERTGSCALSLRKSRLYGVPPPSDYRPEVTSSTLVPGASLKGFVRLTASDHLVVSLGRGVDGRADIHTCTARGCPRCAFTRLVVRSHPPGEVVEVVVKGTQVVEGLYPVSLPSQDGAGPSEGSRLTVTEDINWEDV